MSNEKAEQMLELFGGYRMCGNCGAAVADGNVCGSQKCHPNKRIAELEEAVRCLAKLVRVVQR